MLPLQIMKGPVIIIVQEASNCKTVTEVAGKGLDQAHSEEVVWASNIHADLEINYSSVPCRVPLPQPKSN